MGFREILIAAAAIEIFSPGSLERGAKSTLDTIATVLRNMPPAASSQQQPETASILPTAQLSDFVEPEHWKNYKDCARCGDKRAVWEGICYGKCKPISLVALNLRRGGRKNIAARGRRLRNSPLGIEMQQEVVKRDKAKGRRKGKPNERTKSIRKAYRKLLADPEKSCQEKINAVAKKYRKGDQTLKAARRSVKRAIESHFPCDGCGDCMDIPNE